MPASFYMKLFKTIDDQLGQLGGIRPHKPLASARRKLYRSAVGQLLWATSVRPDISFAVQELSRSLHAPTQKDEKQLQQVLGYLKGTLHFTIKLQPPRKRVLERASSIQIQACFDTAWARSSQPQKATTGVSLSLWGVPVATSSRTQASQASSLAEAELYAMGMAVQDSLHLQSLLQEMHLSQLATPFELTVCIDSSSGKALASKLGLTRKHKHVQLRYLFAHDLIANGQLQLSKIPAGKNHAAITTKHLSASNLHKLLPKLGVTTRAADSRALFSVLNLEVFASPREQQSSFFIGMLAEQPVTVQLVESRVSLRPAHSRSLPELSQAAAQNLTCSQRTFASCSFSGYFLCLVALLCVANYVFANLVNFKLYGLLLSTMSALVQFSRVILVICENLASTTTSLPRALGTSSFALGSMSSTSLQRSLLSTNPRTPAQLSASSATTASTSALCIHSSGTNLCSIFFLRWVASACQGKNLLLSASFAQRSSSSSSFLSFSFNFSNHLEAEIMVSFQHEQLIKVMLANEAYTLPHSLLKHIFKGKLVNQELEEQPAELEAALFKELLPKLPENDQDNSQGEGVSDPVDLRRTFGSHLRSRPKLFAN